MSSILAGLKTAKGMIIDVQLHYAMVSGSRWKVME